MSFHMHVCCQYLPACCQKQQLTVRLSMRLFPQCDIRLKVILYTEICMYLLSLECPSPLLGGIRKESWEPRFLVCCDPITRADSKQVHTQTFQRVAEKFPAENIMT